MSIATDNIKSVLDGLSEKFSTLGFEKKKDLTEDGDSAFAVFAGEKGALKIKYANEIVAVFYANNEASLEGSGKKIVASFLPKSGDNRDVNYVINEISDCLNERFEKKAAAKKVFATNDTYVTETKSDTSVAETTNENKSHSYKTGRKPYLKIGLCVIIAFLLIFSIIKLFPGNKIKGTWYSNDGGIFEIYENGSARVRASIHDNGLSYTYTYKGDTITFFPENSLMYNSATYNVEFHGNMMYFTYNGKTIELYKSQEKAEKASEVLSQQHSESKRLEEESKKEAEIEEMKQYYPSADRAEYALLEEGYNNIVYNDEQLNFDDGLIVYTFIVETEDEYATIGHSADVWYRYSGNEWILDRIEDFPTDYTIEYINWKSNIFGQWHYNYHGLADYYINILNFDLDNQTVTFEFNYEDNGWKKITANFTQTNSFCTIYEVYFEDGTAGNNCHLEIGSKFGVEADGFKFTHN